MKIDFSLLNYNFMKKPLLVGGMAMEYYGLRKAGRDIDLIVAQEDHSALKKLFPETLSEKLKKPGRRKTFLSFPSPWNFTLNRGASHCYPTVKS